MPHRTASEICRIEQQLLVQGPEYLSDAELLGLAVQSPSLARALIGASPRWAEMSRAKLTEIPEFTESRVAQVLALSELSKRVVAKPLIPGEAFCCSEDVAAVYRPRFASAEQEVFLVLALNNKNRVIAEHVVAKGTGNTVGINPRDVFRALIQDGAVRVIAIHNHPSGDPKPSSDDVAVCRRLRDAGRLIGVDLVDFLVVARDGSTSFRDTGLLPES